MHSDDTPDRPDDEQFEDDPGATDPQEAHGGSMAPGLVDDTGHPVTEPAAGPPPLS